MNKKTKKRFRTLFKIITSLVVIIGLFFLAKRLIVNANSVTTLTESAGILGPIILIFLISIGIIFTPIPSVALIITAGFLYGIWEGALYSYLGHLFAAIGTYFAVNKFNIKIENTKYEKYKELIKENKKMLYLMYIIPIIPVSIVSIMAATSKIEWKEFLKIIFISFVPIVLFFSFFGNEISNYNLIDIIGLTIIILILVYVIYELMKKNKIIEKKKKQ